MPTWKSRGLRGSVFEDEINRTNDKYKEQKLALIQKVPTPITPMKIDSENRHITLAYFEQKSTVDYIGVIQGIPVCFDAKECQKTTFALQNIHPHQVEFMKAFEEQDGIAFFLISFTQEGFYYYLPFRHLRRRASTITCLSAIFCLSGSARRREDERASAWMNWI